MINAPLQNWIKKQKQKQKQKTTSYRNDQLRTSNQSQQLNWLIYPDVIMS